MGKLDDRYEDYEKDGMLNCPANIVNKCGRCSTEMRLEFVFPIGDDFDKARWNDEGWLALLRRLSSDQPAPPKFKAFEKLEGELKVRYASLLICARCSAQFQDWVARED